MAAHPEPLSGKRLDSWKEIASFFGRAERTVKRWESERGLPVHRVPGGGRSAVFAYCGELGEWLKGKSQEFDGDDTVTTETGIGAKPEPTHPRDIDPGISDVSPQLRVLGTNPAPHGSAYARFAAWIVPLVLASGLVLYLSSGSSVSRFKALASRRIPNAEATELYLKGRYFWERRTPEDLNKAVDYFTQAIVKDPSDAQAYVGLADSYNLLREFGAMPPSEAYPRALSAAQRAVELDDTSAEAHVSLAFATFWWSWQGVTAEREFRRALQLNPNLVRAHHWYATYLLALHRYPEALDQIDQAQQLDPASNALLADRGFLLWDSGRHAEGLAFLTQLESTDPSLSSTHDYLGRVYWAQEQYDKAAAEWRRSAELRHDKDGLVLADAREKGLAANGLRGWYENELPIQRDLVDRGAGSAYQLGETYAALGRREDALAALQTSFERHEADMLVGAPIPELRDAAAYRKFRAEVNERLAQ
jgi:tetratricopeptide (TPR) repeat protein